MVERTTYSREIWYPIREKNLYHLRTSEDRSIKSKRSSQDRWSQVWKIFVPKFLWSSIFFNLLFFGLKMFFDPQFYFDPDFIWIQTQNFIGAQKNFCHKFFWPNLFGSKTIFRQFFFSPKNFFWVQNNFELTIFYPKVFGLFCESNFSST